jgi:lipopolysaccharide/colanic/teichoic acid biosynthesis glycosyltransferase
MSRLKTTLASSQEYKIISSYNDISEIDENLDIKDIDFVLVSNNLLEHDKNTALLIFYKFVSKGVTCLTDLEFFENLFSRLPKETLRNVIWLIRDISNRQENSIYSATKRLFDFLFAVCLIPVFLPLGILIYFLILIIDKQKPIFFQERVGFNGKIIQICKFRTLINGTETPTKVGKFLRKFRLDEIPQLINILDGNISIVGPRPLQKEDNDLLNKYIPAHVLRDIIKPGLTGWSQLNYKAPCNYSAMKTPEFENDAQKNEYFKDAFVRLAYDVWYAKNASFLLDMEIMFKTAKRAFIKDKKLSE